MFDLDLFFSLKRFAHRDLWKKDEPIWFPLLCLDEYFKNQIYKIEIVIPENVYMSNENFISIGKGTVIEPGVFIKGPCIIGKNCTIRHGAFLREGFICGDNCTIGHSAEIKQSILLDNACATHFTYIGDSILGNAVNLGAGVKCANLRLDRADITVSFQGEKIKSGLKKFGAIIGDKTQVGCNCVLNPGTVLGKECTSYPLLNLGGFFPPKSQIVSNKSWKIKSIENKGQRHAT